MHIRNYCRFNIFIASLVSLLLACQPVERQELSLAGAWRVVLDSANVGEGERWFEQSLGGSNINLPGTLDQAGLGENNELKPAMNNYVLSHLARKYQYIGKAWYQKEVELPSGWNEGKYLLTLERVLWESKVWINGQPVGKEESLIAPHRYELGDQLQPGKNVITIRIDNSNKYPSINVPGNKYPEPTSKDMAHAYTNHTQIKWNGIVGEISLKPLSKLRNIQLYPDFSERELQVEAEVATSKEEVAVDYKITGQGRTVASGEMTAPIVNGKIVWTVNLPDEVKPWSEFAPNLYDLEVSIEGHSVVETFGLRGVAAENGELQLNGERLYLRGTLECAVFPQNGFPHTEKSSWRKVIRTAKSYGLNHIRFHSWCPPKAAFEAADELGFFLQAELPHWSLKVGEDPNTIAFLEAEAQRLLREYGNHPSFVLMSLGNELQGDLSWMNSLTGKLKKQDPRHLYTTTTFSFQDGVGTIPQPEDEYFVTQWTDKGWIRGQGIFNAKAPHFDKDYRNEIDHINVPIISHEIGQYSVYPDLTEIEKYTGVLKPLNFIAVKEDLEKKRLLQYARDFTQASGKLAALLYKEEIERALKTPGFDGFQLLQLQDFPGQGTALVGLLNAFWESKGIIDSVEFSRFNGPVVPLIRFNKAVYHSGETFKAQVQVANFLKPMPDQTFRWTVGNQGENFASGVFSGKDVPLGNEAVLGEISCQLTVDKASELTVSVEIEGTPYINDWPIWVYPEVALESGKVVYTRSLKEASSLLDQGKRVLLNPYVEDLKGVTGRFVPVFWSPVHFPDQPSTMGILCDPKHPALAGFPTDSYTNWQWWDLCLQSKALILDDLEMEPIVRVIDNFVTNRSLGNVFEAKVGGGQLLFTSIDLGTNLEDRPVATHLRKSLTDYMNSNQFNPIQEVTIVSLKSLLK